MAKGSKQKTKLKQQPDEPKEPKTGGVSSQAARKGNKSPSQRGREESQETLAHGGDDGDDPAYLAPGGWSHGGGAWGEPRNTDSWDFTQSQLINQPPPLSRTPAPNPPPNNTTLGNLAPPSRHSPSSRRSPSIDGDEHFAQARDSFGYDQEHNIGHHGHGWDPTPAANNPPGTGATNIPAPSALASPAVRRISEMPQDAPVGVSSIAAAEAAQAEMRAKGVKMSSASAAAKKVEAGNPNMAGNRDSLWSKAHDIANNKLPEHTPFIPSNRPLSQARPAPGKTTGPVVPDWEKDMRDGTRAQHLWEMKTPPAWMAWGGGKPAKPPPQAQPSQPPPRQIRHPQVQQHKKGPSWSNWGKGQTQQVRHAPPSDESSSEEDWEEDEDEWEEEQQWGRQGHGPASHIGRAGIGKHGGWQQGGGGGGRAKPSGGGGWDTSGAGGWDDKSWGHTAGGGAGGGWDHPSTSKVTFAIPEDADGSRNTLSPNQRTQIYNSLLNADLAQKPKHSADPRRMSGQQRGRSFEDHGAWGPAPGGDGWGAQPAAQPQGKKSRHKQDEMGAWGSWGQPEDDWGASQAQPKDKKSKKKKDGGDGFGAWGNTGASAAGEGWGAAPPAAGWGDGWDPPPTEKQSKKKSKKGEVQQADGWGNTNNGWGVTNGGGWGEEEEDNGWDEGGGGNDQSWAAWKVEAHDDSGWGPSGGGQWGPDGNENDHKVKFSQGGGAAAWGMGDQTSMSHTMSMAHGSHGVPGGGVHKGGAAKNVHAQHQQGMDDVKFLDSGGAAFTPANNAFFNTQRPAKDRFHWMFPPDKDEQVALMMSIVQNAAYGLGTLGLSKFLETRERGALFTNASFRLPDHPTQPIFDWVPFDVLCNTLDKTLQQSVGFYDPAQIVIVFVYLPSHTGNSVAIWRRKLPVPGNVRRMYQPQIDIVKKSLRQPKDYVVYLEEMPPNQKRPKRQPKAPASDRNPSIANPKGNMLTKQLQAQLHAQQWPGTVPTEKEAKAIVQAKAKDPKGKGKGKTKEDKPKKKKRWWNIFSNL